MALDYFIHIPKMKTTDLPKINEPPHIYYWMIGFVVTMVSMQKYIKLPFIPTWILKEDYQ